jgi:hypothetical protein
LCVLNRSLNEIGEDGSIMHLLAFILLCGALALATLLATVGDELGHAYRIAMDLVHGQSEYESALVKLRKSL